ncbi:unnamed protein product, partial [Ectocarpus fasciculatus]
RNTLYYCIGRPGRCYTACSSPTLSERGFVSSAVKVCAVEVVVYCENGPCYLLKFNEEDDLSASKNSIGAYANGPNVRLIFWASRFFLAKGEGKKKKVSGPWHFSWFKTAFFFVTRARCE